jgi:hypothetical protein
MPASRESVFMPGCKQTAGHQRKGWRTRQALGSVAESEWWNGLEVIWGFTWGYVNIQVRAPTIMRDLMGYN